LRINTQTNFGNALPRVESLLEDKLAFIFTIYELQVTTIKNYTIPVDIFRNESGDVYFQKQEKYKRSHEFS